MTLVVHADLAVAGVEKNSARSQDGYGRRIERAALQHVRPARPWQRSGAMQFGVRVRHLIRDSKSASSAGFGQRSVCLSTMDVGNRTGLGLRRRPSSGRSAISIGHRHDRVERAFIRQILVDAEKGCATGAGSAKRVAST